MSAPSSLPTISSMEQDCIRTGFWINQDLRDPDFECLDEIRTGQNSLMDYLHGWCTFFALALYDLAGFPMYCLADEDEWEERDCPVPAGKNFPLIHDFCVLGGIDDSALFVDCRGIIGSEQAFLEEFRDFFTDYQLIRYTPEQVQNLKDFLWSPASGCDADQYYLEACNYIKHHLQEYIPDQI